MLTEFYRKCVTNSKTENIPQTYCIGHPSIVLVLSMPRTQKPVLSLSLCRRSAPPDGPFKYRQWKWSATLGNRIYIYCVWKKRSSLKNIMRSAKPTDTRRIHMEAEAAAFGNHSIRHEHLNYTAMNEWLVVSSNDIRKCCFCWTRSVHYSIWCHLCSFHVDGLNEWRRATEWWGDGMMGAQVAEWAACGL